MGQKGTISEWDLQALIDGALSSAEEAYVLNVVNATPELQEKLNALQKQKQLLQLWWKDH